MSKVKLAIVGVGNCASSLVQGLEYYKDAEPTETVPGLMHVDLGGYHVRDVEVVAAEIVDLGDQEPGGEMVLVEPDRLVAKDQGDVVPFLGGREAGAAVVKPCFFSLIRALGKERGKMPERARQVVERIHWQSV